MKRPGLFISTSLGGWRVLIGVLLLWGAGTAQEVSLERAFQERWPRLSRWLDERPTGGPGFAVHLVDRQGRSFGRAVGLDALGEDLGVEHPIDLDRLSDFLLEPSLRLALDGGEGSDWKAQILEAAVGAEALASVGLECLAGRTIEDLLEGRIRYDVTLRSHVVGRDARRPIAEVLRQNVHPVGRWSDRTVRRPQGDRFSDLAILQWIVERRTRRPASEWIDEVVAPHVGLEATIVDSNSASDVGAWTRAWTARDRGEQWDGPVLPEVSFPHGLAMPSQDLPKLVPFLELQPIGSYRSPNGGVEVRGAANLGVVVGEIEDYRFAIVGRRKGWSAWSEALDPLVSDVVGADAVRQQVESSEGGWNSAIGLGGSSRDTAFGPRRRRWPQITTGVFSGTGFDQVFGAEVELRLERRSAELQIGDEVVDVTGTWPSRLGETFRLVFERNRNTYVLNFDPRRLEQGCYLSQNRTVGGTVLYRASRVRLRNRDGLGAVVQPFEVLQQAAEQRIEQAQGTDRDLSPVRLVGLDFRGRSTLLATGSLDARGEWLVDETTLLPFGRLSRALTQVSDRFSGLDQDDWVFAMESSLPARFDDVPLDHGGDLLAWLAPFSRRLDEGGRPRALQQILDEHLWRSPLGARSLDGSDLGCGVHQEICRDLGLLQGGAARALTAHARERDPDSGFCALDDMPRLERFRCVDPSGELIPFQRSEIEFAGGVAGNPEDLLSLALSLGWSQDTANETRFFGGNAFDDLLGDRSALQRIEYRDDGPAWTRRIVQYPTLELTWCVYLAESDPSLADQLEQALVEAALGRPGVELELEKAAARSSQVGVPWSLEGALRVDGRSRALSLNADFSSDDTVTLRWGEDTYELRGEPSSSLRFTAETEAGTLPAIRVEARRAIFSPTASVLISIDPDGLGVQSYGGEVRATKD